MSIRVERVVELLPVSAAGVILLAPDGTLEVPASSSQRAQLLELFAVQTEDGPSVDRVRSGVPVTGPDTAGSVAENVDIAYMA